MMYNKVIVSDIFSPPSKWDFKWLTAKRSSIDINEHSLSFNGNSFEFSEMQEMFLVRYKSFFVFNYYIFGFKYKEKYYQIGYNNQQKELIQKATQTQEQFQKTLIKDVIFITLVAVLIYLTQIKL